MGLQKYLIIIDHVGIMDMEIYEKYLTDETNETVWIICAASSNQHDLIALLKTRQLIQD